MFITFYMTQKKINKKDLSIYKFAIIFHVMTKKP